MNAEPGGQRMRTTDVAPVEDLPRLKKMVERGNEGCSREEGNRFEELKRHTIVESAQASSSRAAGAAAAGVRGGRDGDVPAPRTARCC